MQHRWLSGKAADLAEWCLKRADKWVSRSDFLTDVSKWLDGNESWAAIRARRNAKPED